ncbi:hypothetical protein [Blastococcus saxobsidens]|uniref:Uncharacterized protein n=1 Tax=Blastococcus saxobsidens TaxID=138336 RepID=A0A4Q7Y8Z8_9ACTN|nr:hypothetical protein [Blastococcus saxobsidens]RZU33592.1 hypothetical protein BKA19_3324 [Blastococcus saxobsidens]
MARGDDVANTNGMIRSMAGGYLDELGVQAGGLVLRSSTSWEVRLGAATSVGDTVPAEPTSIACVAAHMPLLVADLDAVGIGEDGTLSSRGRNHDPVRTRG